MESTVSLTRAPSLHTDELYHSLRLPQCCTYMSISYGNINCRCARLIRRSCRVKQSWT